MVDWNALPEPMLRNYVERYERGGVQRTPRLRFIDAEGRACLAAALCGARTAADVMEHAFRLGHPFRGGILERISRQFEASRLTPVEMYDGCVLELARRAGAADPAGAEPAPAPRASALAAF